MLSKEQVSFFDTFGYLVFRGLYSAEEMAVIDRDPYAAIGNGTQTAGTKASPAERRARAHPTAQRFSSTTGTRRRRLDLPTANRIDSKCLPPLICPHTYPAPIAFSKLVRMPT